MKSHFLTFCISMMMFCLCACGSSEDEPTISPIEITTKTEAISVDNQGSDVSYTFTAPAAWRAVSDADWCSPSPAQGTQGEKTVKLTLTQNPDTEIRSCSVKFEIIEGSKLFLTLTVNQAGREVVNVDDENPNAPQGLKHNASGLVKQIVVGWNLGNTCESGIWDGWNGSDLDIETNWGNPKTTQQMITALKSAGFNAIRIPTRWYVHADNDLNINAQWMARIKEIVDYAYSQDMYVVLNSHHDNWYDRLPSGYDANGIKAKFTNMWTQIANTFKDYDEHLILAAANEIVSLNADGSENWGTPSEANAKFASELMQTFVDAVRATGGNNQWRCLMVQPWAANFDNALLPGFAMPTDKVADRLILEFHHYTWSYSTETGSDAKYYWGSPYSKYSPWYANGDQVVDDLYNRVTTNFIDRGIPVIMAEFGCVQHNKASDIDAADQSRAYYHNYVVTEARKRGIPGFYWDNGAFEGNGENFGLLDRNTCTFPARARIALDGIVK